MGYVAIGVMAVIAFNVILAVQTMRRYNNSSKKQARGEGGDRLTPHALKVGDYISHLEFGRARVIGTAEYTQGITTWGKLFIETPTGNTRWVSYRESWSAGDWRYMLWTERSADEFERCGQKTVAFDGRVYSQYGEGTAQFSANDETNLGVPDGSVSLRNFVSRDGDSIEPSYFSFENHRDMEVASFGIELDVTIIGLERVGVVYER